MTLVGVHMQHVAKHARLHGFAEARNGGHGTCRKGGVNCCMRSVANWSDEKSFK